MFKFFKKNECLQVYDNLTLIGCPSSGKTLLLKELVKRNIENTKIFLISDSDFLEEVTSNYEFIPFQSSEQELLEFLNKSVKKAFKEKSNVLIAVDDIKALYKAFDRDEDKINKYLSILNNKNCKYIITSQLQNFSECNLNLYNVAFINRDGSSGRIEVKEQTRQRFIGFAKDYKNGSRVFANIYRPIKVHYFNLKDLV